MKKILPVSLSILFVSCAGFNNVDSVKGIERQAIHAKSDYERPHFYIKDHKPSLVERKIAKVTPTVKPEVRKLSNKTSYFVSLWQQYETIRKMTKTDKQLKHCPQFHNDFVEQQKNFQSPRNLTLKAKDIQASPDLIVYHPYYVLPYKGVDLFTYLNKKNAWSEADKHLKDALISHNKKNIEELKEVCHKGSSDSYYVFENMISFYSTKNDFIRSKKALHSSLNIPVFANMMIINSLSSKFSPLRVSNQQEQVITKMNMEWFKNYLYELSQGRNNTNKSVSN